MCTVTLITKNNSDFVLTSNRDEAPDRISRDPEFYSVDNTKLLFPMDQLSGGTWIGISEKKRVVCLLNGAFEAHSRKLKYRMSRGLVAKDFLIVDNIIHSIEAYNFAGIEPFTMVISDWNSNLQFYELVWDGIDKHFRVLPLKPKIWSSSTLYNKTMRTERLQWFENFKSENELNGETALKFHKIAGKNNMDYGVIMNRENVKTTSITQIEKNFNTLEMRYESLNNHLISNNSFTLNT